MDEFENVANWVSDMDQQWWPFLFMRPSPEQSMTSLRVAALAALYGVFLGTAVNALVALSGQSVNPLVFPLFSTAAFFVVYRFTFALAWNRRAARLRQRTRVPGCSS